MFVRDVPLYQPGAFRVEATVFTCGTSADKKMWMRLAAILPSTEEDGVGQVEGVDTAHCV